MALFGSARARASAKERVNVWLLVCTTLLVLASIFLFMPPTEKINQGLDISGGLSVVLSASNADGSSISSDDLETSRDIIETRVNALGANEAIVQVQGSNQILVQIPGLTDTQSAIDTLGTTGSLVFARLDSFTDEEVVSAIEAGNYASESTITDDFGFTFSSGEKLNLEAPDGTYTPLITGSNIESVSIGRASETSTYYSVNLSLDSEGTLAFAQATADLVSTHGKIVIILDGIVQSAPAVQSEITSGEVSITGNYSLEEAQSLQTILQSGSLPINFDISQSQVVGPTLGQDALAAGVVVAAIGLALVMVYLLFFYQGFGLITAAAMLVFALIYLGILAGLSALGQFSLTLSGVAGIVLTIGMAADSSILTLERFREELRMGRSVRAASITGVRHAIQTSIDADLVTLVSALSLFFLASASVKGFGLTLALGIFCDIIMMLLFKAPFIRLLAPRFIDKHPGFWGIRKSLARGSRYLSSAGRLSEALEKSRQNQTEEKEISVRKDINFLGYRKVFLSIAAVLVLCALAACALRGLEFGIEFVGGSSISYNNTGELSIEDMRDAFDEQGAGEAIIQTTATNDVQGFYVRIATTDASEASTIAYAVADKLSLDIENIEISTIAPSWGASVIQSSLIAFCVSLVLIIIYIAIRFEYRMGVIAVITLLHDLLLVVGVYALLGREVTPNTVAAVLTIMGYSLYDTVVVFHRITDNMKTEGIRCTFMTMANHSINSVLLRTINTTLSSLIPVFLMLLFGGDTLKDFAFAMVIGLICGSYSSFAVATPLFSIWKTHEKRYAKLAKKYGDDVQLFEFGNPMALMAAGVSPNETVALEEKQAALSVKNITEKAEDAGGYALIAQDEGVLCGARSQEQELTSTAEKQTPSNKKAAATQTRRTKYRKKKK